MPGAVTQGYQPNAALAYLYRQFFDQIKVESSWLEAARAAASQGSVVYVLRNQSFIDFLALDHIVKRYGLPQIRFAQDTGLWLLEPLGKGWLEGLFSGRSMSVRDRLADALFAQNGSAVLFLKRPPTLLERGKRTRGRSEGDEALSALFELQKEQPNRRILLFPQAFVWTKRPDTRGADVFDYLFGTREWPGKLRTAAQFLANFQDVDFRAGEVLDLKSFVEDPASQNDSTALVRRATYALMVRMERERRAILGPAKKPNDRMREEVLRSPRLQAVINELAGEGTAERMLLVAKAYGMLRDMEAAPTPEGHTAFKLAIDAVSKRIYGGLEVDEEGIAKVREAAKRGAVVFLPSHKSHIDYIMLSNVLRDAHLQLPLIAAGDNLAFFPMGPIFRRGGAFFIRRSFKGDKLYGAVVDAYIRRLLREGYSIEFFLEGGRSRTGKLLPPKLGLLNIVVDAALSQPHKAVTFIPVSIGYERLLEERSYMRELSGGEKHKEDASSLLRSTSVLGGFYGRVNVQFGEPITLTQLRGEMAMPETNELAPPQRRSLVTRLAHRVMADINRVTMVTPGALVAMLLLAAGRRGLPHVELSVAAERVVAQLNRQGARMSRSLVTPSSTMRPDALREAAQLFVRGELVQANVPGQTIDNERKARAAIYTGDDVVYTVLDDKRLALSMSGSTILHFFVDRALIATSLRAGQSDRCQEATLRDRVQALSRLFKYEFMFRADASFEEIFDETLSAMVRDGELRREAGEVMYGAGHDGQSGERWGRFYVELLAPYLQGYQAAARSLSLLLKGPMPRKEFIKKALVIGQRMALSGDIARPEAISNPIIDNALSALIDQQYALITDNKIELAPSFSSASTVGLIEARILAFSMLEQDRRASSAGVLP